MGGDVQIALGKGQSLACPIGGGVNVHVVPSGSGHIAQLIGLLF